MALSTLDEFWHPWQADRLFYLRTQMLHRGLRSSVKLIPRINEVVLIEESQQTESESKRGNGFTPRPRKWDSNYAKWEIMDTNDEFFVAAGNNYSRENPHISRPEYRIRSGRISEDISRNQWQCNGKVIETCAIPILVPWRINRELSKLWKTTNFARNRIGLFDNVPQPRLCEGEIFLSPLEITTKENPHIMCHSSQG